MDKEDKTEITLKTKEGNTCRIYCGGCGGVIKQKNIFCNPLDLYSFRCHNCNHSTPLFVYQLDALQYYKDTWGTTGEWVEKNN